MSGLLLRLSFSFLLHCNGICVFYKMSNATQIGQITGRPSGDNSGFESGDGSGGRPKIDGIEYDYVTHVDINGDSSIPLGFNKDDDPQEVARNWCIVHCVDLDQMPRIVEHLLPMVDPVARAQRVERERIAASKQLVHIPSFVTCCFTLTFSLSLKGSIIMYINKYKYIHICLYIYICVRQKVCNYEINGKMQLQPMLERVEQTNNELKEEKSPFAVDINDKNNKYTKAFRVLFDDILVNQKLWHVNEFPEVICELIIDKLLQWPSSKVLPILDLIRVLMLHGDGVEKLGGNSKLRESVVKHIASEAGQSDGNMQMIVCRLVCNYLAKRPRSEDERSGKEIPQELVSFIQEVLSNLAVAANNKKSAVHTAYIMLAHKYYLTNSFFFLKLDDHYVMLWYGKFKVVESDLYLVMTSALFELMSSQELNDKIIYYCLSVIGTIAWASSTAKQEIQEVYEQQLKEIVTKARHDNLASLQEIGKDLWNLFEFK
ncbi:hypothetical protein RFI_26965 [Reticulomyxa filosa]|uniref:Uncharacterized protein n=1 Tax=Reticulomyxa filosa TaxID=46433 RepID=X6M8U8_RETFI|nr:hypothetical protein RFI_26965 [Reticulomyxa filosa]|eukprot:ETO10408.1 hypothetical protein RFI_26965 [Reticulomyxa filosa]